MRRRSSNACPRSCKRIPPEQGPGHPQLKTPQPAAASSAAAAPTAARKPRRQLPLNPTTCPFAGQRIRSEPGAGAAGGPPKGEAQSIPKKLAAFSGAGGRPIGRANANALAAKGTAGRGLVTQPVGEGGDLGGGVVARGQRISRRSPAPAAVAAGKARPVLGGWAAIEHHNQIPSGQVLIGQPASWCWGSARWRQKTGS